MLCQRCNKNEAVVEYCHYSNGQEEAMYLCGECAAKLGLVNPMYTRKIEIPFEKLLTGLLSSQDNAKNEEDDKLEHVVCPNCGMSYEEFTKLGKFGCAECYNVFAPLIAEYIENIQGSKKHVGKKLKVTMPDMPEDVVGDSENKDNSDSDKDLTKNQLKLLLAEAVEMENYEAAAKYRDMIKAKGDEANG